MTIRRRVTRCAGCGLVYTIKYRDDMQVEMLWEHCETAHRLRAPLCLAGPGQRRMVRDEEEVTHDAH